MPDKSYVKGMLPYLQLHVIRKPAFLVVFLIQSLAFTSMAQSVTLYNRRMPGTNNVFIGIDNILILRGATNSITSVLSEKAAVRRAGDTLFIGPRGQGTFELVINTNDGPVSHQLNAEYLPKAVVMLTKGGEEKNEVLKEAVLQSNNIRVSGIGQEINFYEGYVVTDCTLIINNEAYQFSGNSFPEEVRQSIAGLKSGSKLEVRRVIARSESGNKMELKSNRVFTIL